MTLGATKAVAFAIMAAVFYAISSPVSKVLLEDVSPYLMASLLYLGAGIVMVVVRSANGSRREEAPFSRGDLPYVVAMILLDIAAPILLMYGLLSSPASSVSLLNNFEIVATTVIAVTIFGERVSARMWAAVAVITLSVILLSVDGSDGLSFSPGSLAVVAACLCWGLENNCTSRLSSTGPSRVVAVKGVFSGLGALIIAMFMGIGDPSVIEVVGALILGFVSYGLSLYLYISAQGAIGAAKVSAYYAAAPFIGAVLSLALLGEPLSGTYAVALAVMVLGTAIMTYDTLRPVNTDEKTPEGDENPPGPVGGRCRAVGWVSRRGGGLVGVLPDERDQHTADGVPQEDEQDEYQRIQAECSCGADVEHVGDGVLESSQDEHGDAEEDRQEALALLVEVDGDEHQDTAHQALEDHGVPFEGELPVHQGGGVVVRHHQTDEQASDEVPDDDYEDVLEVGRGVLDHVSHLAGVEVEPEGDDREESDGEHDRPDPFDVAGEVDATADGDGDPGQERPQQNPPVAAFVRVRGSRR